MALFVVEVRNSNACQAWAYDGRQKFSARPGYGEPALVVVAESGDDGLEVEEPTVALFSNKEQAEVVAAACRWANQTSSVRAARRRVREEGRIVEFAGDLAGCQDSYR